MKGAVVAAPDMVYGHLRILARTDGKYVVVDTRRPPGHQTIHVFRTLALAARAASQWHAEGHA